MSRYHPEKACPTNSHRNSRIIPIMQSDIALNMIPSIDCYRVVAVPKAYPTNSVQRRQSVNALG